MLQLGDKMTSVPSVEKNDVFVNRRGAHSHNIEIEGTGVDMRWLSKKLPGVIFLDNTGVRFVLFSIKTSIPGVRCLASFWASLMSTAPAYHSCCLLLSAGVVCLAWRHDVVFKSDPTRPDQTRLDPTGPDRTRPDPTGPDQTEAGWARLGPAGPGRARSGLVGPGSAFACQPCFRAAPFGLGGPSWVWPGPALA